MSHIMQFLDSGTFVSHVAAFQHLYNSLVIIDVLRGNGGSCLRNKIKSIFDLNECLSFFILVEINYYVQ